MKCNILYVVFIKTVIVKKIWTKKKVKFSVAEHLRGEFIQPQYAKSIINNL